MATGKHQRALVVGADVMSSIIDYTDRTTCVLFGDGAGAVIVEPAVEEGLEIIGFEHEIDGSGGPALQMPAGGSLNPASHETVEKRMHYVKQDGQAVFKFAVRKTEEICAPRAREATVTRPTRWRCSCRTRRTAASSCRPPTGSGCPSRRS